MMRMRRLSSRRLARLFVVLGIVLALCGWSTWATADVQVQSADGKLRVMLDGELFAEYRYSGYAKPVIYPLIGPGGVRMTRDYPMVPNVAGEPHDHDHHKSMWFTHGDVNGVDFWTEGENCGRIVQKGQARVDSWNDGATISTKNQWHDSQGAVVCSDRRRVTFWTSQATGSARFVDWEVTLHASAGDVTFGDTKEGTMGIRMRPELQLVPTPETSVPAMPGQAMNSEGITGAAIWGKRARWIDYWGQVGGRTLGIAMLDHPANPRHPTWWHARDYGLVAANPFGRHDFEQGPAGQGDWTIPANESRTLRYRFVLHEGDAHAANIETRFSEYTHSGRPRVLPAGEQPQDQRLQAPKTLQGPFEFHPPATPQEWGARAQHVRRRMQVALGLWPLPERAPIRATIHGRVEREGYSLEKVYFESYPGHFVTGNLYRPLSDKTNTNTNDESQVPAKLPMILCPHGHWENGRYFDMGIKGVREQIVVGAERFEVGGRYVVQAPCVQLARMGCMVFNYDMVGYADSQQIPFELAHRHHAPRPEFDTPTDWGFYSTQAELRLQSIMGLQTYNSLCALDWVCGLPEVDTQRIGVTGASGGGTQTMILAALDPRPDVLFPAVMVSNAMQGGCMCENASLLRLDAGNVEFAALAAPRPLGMTTANDWTRDLATNGLPDLQRLYAMLAAPDHVMAATLNHFPHNYNYVSRAIMYRWMNRHLSLGWEEPIVEEDFRAHTTEEMRVWNAQHPAPAGGPEHERALLRAMTAMADRQIAAVTPADPQSWAAFREVVEGAWRVMIGREPPSPAEIQRRQVRRTDHGDYWQYDELLRFDAHGEEIPVVRLVPKQWRGTVVVWVDGDGKQALFNDDLRPVEPIRRLLDAGQAVATADLMGQGEFLIDGRTIMQIRAVDDGGDCAAFTMGYNSTLFAQRVHDILTLVAAVEGHETPPDKVVLVGVNGAGPWAAAAQALLGSRSDGLALDTGGFRFGDLSSWRDVQFVPGAVKYGDLPALLALSAPQSLYLMGEDGKVPPIVAAAYRAADAASDVTSHVGSSEGVRLIVDWLIKGVR